MTTKFDNTDPTVPFWKSNIDVQSLFYAYAHRPERAAAWLRYHGAPVDSRFVRNTALMRGRFTLGILGGHTYHWTFTPDDAGVPAVAIPVFDESFRIVDFVAISRHNLDVWGGCTGFGEYLGSFSNPLHVFRSPLAWLANDCEGVVPLAKSFFPLIPLAPCIVAQDCEHAWQIANLAFVEPAERFGLDANRAEQTALDRISFKDAAS